MHGIASGVVQDQFGSSEYADHVGTRLLDFFGDHTPWQRRLWDVGSVMALDELAEASAWANRGVLSQGAVTWMARDVERLVGRDRAIGDKPLRQQLTSVLRSPLLAGGRHHRQLQELSRMIRDGYLRRWLLSLESTRQPSAETWRTAARQRQPASSHAPRRSQALPRQHS